MKKRSVIVGITLFVLAIIINQMSILNDFKLGIIFGVAIGVLLIGIFGNKRFGNKKSDCC